MALATVETPASDRDLVRIEAAVSSLASEVANRLEVVHGRVEAVGRRVDDVRIVAVTKGFGIDAVRASVSAGLVDIGENYGDELLAKASRAPAECRWHYLGALQRRKIKHLAPVVSVWHSLDRPSALDEVSKVAPDSEVFLQVNVGRIAGRPGCEPADLDELYEESRRAQVRPIGLMAVAPPGSLDEARRCFRWLAERAYSLGLSELSMGMSDDFQVALEEGATVLRLGRALFGERPSQKAQHRYNNV